MARSLQLALTGALLLVGLASPAYAQEAGTTEDDEARSLFEAGRTAYQGARYESALRYFEDAYELSGRRALLFNIGSTLERLQRNEEALARFREYIQAMPDAPNREIVQRRISFLEGILNGSQTPEPTPDPEPQDATAVSVGAAAPSDSDGGGSVIDEWWFWTIIAVAVVGAGAGITAGIVVGTSGVEQPLPGDFSVVFALQGEL